MDHPKHHLGLRSGEVTTICSGNWITWSAFLQKMRIHQTGVTQAHAGMKRFAAYSDSRASAQLLLLLLHLPPPPPPPPSPPPPRSPPPPDPPAAAAAAAAMRTATKITTAVLKSILGLHVPGKLATMDCQFADLRLQVSGLTCRLGCLRYLAGLWGEV